MLHYYSVIAQRFPFFNLNVENGLIQSQATGIAQDKFGHLWIGTLGGLSRYDGKSFSNYSVRNGMISNMVNAVATDKAGKVWIGTPKGLSEFDGKTFRHFSFATPENPTANSVTEIRPANDGTIWCRAGGKLYSISNGKSRQFDIPDKDAVITSVFVDGENLLIAKAGGTLYRYHTNTWDSSSINEPSLKAPATILDIYKDSRQRIWLATNGGLYNLVGDNIVISSVRGQKLYALPPVLSVTEDKYKNIWLGTTTGAFRLNDSSLIYCNKKNGLTDNAINQLLTDAEGNIWMASDGQGIFRFSGAQFSVLNESAGLPSAQIMSIAAQGNRLYLGTYDAGLYVYENGTISKVPVPLKSRPAITAIFFHNNEIWLGTRGEGLWRYNGRFKQYTTPTLPSNLITGIYADKDNRLWIGFDNGIAYFRADTLHKLKTPGTITEDFIALGTDSVLLATNNGLKLYTSDNLIQFKTNTAADSSTPQCFAIRGKELWIGTSDNGVICYNRLSGKAFAMNKSNGLHSDFIYNIITDNDGNIWLGTGYGIHKISLAGGKPSVQFYGKNQGITGMESNHNAVFKMHDGSIWFGTTNGALHYNPASKLITPLPATIILQSIKLFGEDITDSSYFDSTDSWYNVPYKLHLPYRKNNLTFTFQALTLTDLAQVRYRYRIGGLENKWSDWSDINTVTYSAIPPGKYLLEVECSTGNGSTRKLNYPFEIITPFHKTGWFRLLILIACILLGISIQYIVNRRKQNRIALTERLRREEQVKVRERTAEDFHDEVGNKLTRINVLTNVLKNKIATLSPESLRILDQIQDNSNQLYNGTRDILWSLKPSNDSLYEIIYRLRDFGAELFQDTEIDFSFTATDELLKTYKLPLDVSRNLMMIFKEALNNCLKYAKATQVKLEAVIEEKDILHITLTDNGTGFDYDTVAKGHGIDNMNKRAQRIKGKLYIDTHPGEGTVISLRFRVVPGAL